MSETKTHWSVTDRIEALRDQAHHDPRSLDEPLTLDDESGATRGELLVDTAPDPLEAAMTREVWQRVREAMRERLTPRQRLVLTVRFGIPHAWKVEELAEALGVHRSRIGQLQQRAVELLREAVSQ